MIVRILGDLQYEVPDGELDAMNQHDAEVEKAVDDGDEARFGRSLASLLDYVRKVGTPLPDDALVPSEFVLPADDTTLAEVRELLGDEGLVPG